MDLAVAREQGRRTRHRRSRQRQQDRARAQKNTLQPHHRRHWVIPPKANSAFVAAMEDVLDIYTRPRDGDCPLVYLDETSKQLIAETRVPMPMKAGRPARFDYEYQRNGTANLFMMFAPLEGWRSRCVVVGPGNRSPSPSGTPFEFARWARFLSMPAQANDAGFSATYVVPQSGAFGDRVIAITMHGEAVN